MIKISAVSYLNTIPFIYGIERSKLKEVINLELDYPAMCAQKLINDSVDIALVPVVAITEPKQAHIISDYCIGANGIVDTVCLYSDVPINEVESITLDFQSRTSVELLRILIRDFWKIQPLLKASKIGFEKDIRERNAALVIGDKAFSLNKKHRYIYDLSAVWKEMTGKPFVFAVWVANKIIPDNFIFEFNNALEFGVLNIDKALMNKGIGCLECESPKDYLHNKICYNLDSKMREGMDLFLERI